MNSLSPELIREIFLHLDEKADISRLRLVQQAFASIGEEALFTSLDVSPTFQSLTRLIELSRQSHIAPYVRKIILSVDAMRVIVWSTISRHLGNSSAKDVDKLDYRTLIVFRSLVNEYQEFQKSSDYVAMLSTAFSRFPRLCHISLLESSPSTSANSGTVTLMDRYAHTIDPPHFHGSWGEKDHLRAFSALIDASYFTGTMLGSFKTTGLIDQVLFEDRELLRRAAIVFRNSRELRFLFCGEEQTGTQVSQRLLESYLFGMIAPAVGLQKLAVEFNVCPPAGRGGALFRKVFGGKNQRWEMLEELVIGGINVKCEELIGFLTRHKSTLRVLQMKKCGLVGRSWDEVKEFLEKDFKLKKLDLDGHIDHD
ncbi:hypothetical protein DFP73DRAFT_274882 [Morchella snyderi]|nr:hypothetical protein DFP73DRAFT_274882 [Morchella snyderi]